MTLHEPAIPSRKWYKLIPKIRSPFVKGIIPIHPPQLIAQIPYPANTNPPAAVPKSIHFLASEASDLKPKNPELKITAKAYVISTNITEISADQPSIPRCFQMKMGIRTVVLPNATRRKNVETKIPMNERLG